MSRAWHAVLAIVVLASLILQIAVLLAGGQDVNSGQASAHLDAATRFARLFSYFTIQSNLLVLFVAASLALNPQRDGRLWRVLRLDSLLGIAITGLVFSTLLAGLAQHTGAAAWANYGFHYFSPVWTLLGWLLFGPRLRITPTVVAQAFIWPLAWIIFTLVRGAMTGWYPYPFLNVDKLGHAHAAINIAVILVTAVVFALIFLWLDRKLPGSAARGGRTADPLPGAD